MSDTLTLTVGGNPYVIFQPTARIGLAQSAAFTISMVNRTNREREIENIARAKGDEPALEMVKPPTRAVENFEARYGPGLEHDMDVDALGADLYERMLDEVTLPELKQAAAAAHMWIAIGGERGTKAARSWMGLDTGDDDDAPKASTPTDEANTTPPPDSTSGTTSPNPSKSASPKKRPTRSPGKTSGNTGTKSK